MVIKVAKVILKQGAVEIKAKKTAFGFWTSLLSDRGVRLFDQQPLLCTVLLY